MYLINEESTFSVFCFFSVSLLPVSINFCLVCNEVYLLFVSVNIV